MTANGDYEPDNLPPPQSTAGPPQETGDRTLPQVVTRSIPGDYCFSLQAEIGQMLVGEVQGGYRIDLQYSGTGQSINFGLGKSCLSPKTFSRLDGTAAIVSGNDWVFVSNTGQIDFDSRLTFSFGSATDDAAPFCLVGGRIRGRTNLRECRSEDNLVFTDADSDAEILSRWKAGFGPAYWLPLVLAVSFDIPTAGFEKGQTQAYNECRELERSLFVARGHAKFGPGPNSPVNRLVLDLFRVVAVDWKEPAPSNVASRS